MVWIKTRQVKRLEREKVVKSGWSGKFDKKTNFPKKRNSYRDYGEFDSEDHEIDAVEEQYNKQNRAIERSEK